MVEILDKYQKLLRLQDWDIKVEYVPQSIIPGRAGQIEYLVTHKVGVIRLPTHDTYEPTIRFPQQDIEHAIVHELVHLLFSVIDDTIERQTVANYQYEFAINAIVGAILNRENSDE